MPLSVLGLNWFLFWLVLGTTTIASSCNRNQVGFIKGANQPWGNEAWGRWLGPWMNAKGPNEFNVQQWTKTCQAANERGVKMLRIWLFEAGSGLEIDESKRITKVDDHVWKNLDTAIEIAEKYHIDIYPTLFTEVTDTNQWSLGHWMNDSTFQNMLRENVLRPFFQKFGNKIKYVDLFNELNHWCDPYFSDARYNTQVCQKWIQDTVTYIKTMQVESKLTVSQILVSQSNTSNQVFAQLGLDFYDIHSYVENADQVHLPLPSELFPGQNKPVLLGEFGESVGKGDEFQAKIIDAFLKQAKQKCYLGALYWSLGFPGESQRFENHSCNERNLMHSLFRCDGHARIFSSRAFAQN